MKNTNIGLRIKELREQANLRQNQVAAYLGMDQSTLSKLETGKRTISVEQLEKLSELYGCDFEIFENHDVKIKPIKIALRAKEITTEDLNIIAVVNHIAANSQYMAKLLDVSHQKCTNTLH